MRICMEIYSEFYKKHTDDELCEQYEMVYAMRFYKKRTGDKIWWVRSNRIGELEFTFDKKDVKNKTIWDFKSGKIE